MTLITIDKMVGDRIMFRVKDIHNDISFLATCGELIEMRKMMDLMIGEMK
jgi:hypothetical protein